MFLVNPLHYTINGLGGKLGYNHFGSLIAKFDNWAYMLCFSLQQYLMFLPQRKN